MPGFATNIANITHQKMIDYPQFTLILIMALILFILFSNRFIGGPNYLRIIGLLIIFSVIIVGSFLTWFKQFGFGHDTGVVRFSDIFNSGAGRNFISVFLLIFFIIYIYELEKYSNDDEVYESLGIVITKRTIGRIFILFYTFLTAYTMHLTTTSGR